jgi:asparagine synthase (glutamine-hydrolysing)
MVWHLDEPYGGGLPSWYVFAFMARDVKVGLTGSGSDELFGDYGRFRQYEHSNGQSAIGRAMDRISAAAPRAARALALVTDRPGQEVGTQDFSPERFKRDYLDRYYYFTDADKRRLVLEPGVDGDTAAALAVHASGNHPRDAITAASMSTQLPDEFLAMTDRFSMAHSLEARVPFLDREFVALMATVPAAMRTDPHDLKYLLKRAVGDLLPAEVLRGRKRGFVIPTAAWLRGRLRPLVMRLLGPAHLRSQGLFRPELYDTLVAPHLDGRADRHAQIWTLLMFQLWHALYVERTSLEPPAALWSDLC